MGYTQRSVAGSGSKNMRLAPWWVWLLIGLPVVVVLVAFIAIFVSPD
jgi:hypothetical protein